MNQIRPWLYIGRQRDTEDQNLLEKHQIDAMLQLAERVDQPQIDSLYLAVKDGELLPHALLKEGIDFVKTNKELGNNILVACKAGISRSAAFVIAVLKEVEQITLLEAFREVKQFHPETLPQAEVWLSLCIYYKEHVAFSDLTRIHNS